MGLRLLILAVMAGMGGAQTRRVAPGTEMARDFLAAHNEVRKQVGVGPLMWSDVLAGRAQTWANSLLATGAFAHSRNSPDGENLYDITGGTTEAGAVVKAWADEAGDYDYAANACRKMCGHYTQIVWSDTREVGCGVARGGGREVWVCHYNPPGNWVGKRPW